MSSTAGHNPWSNDDDLREQQLRNDIDTPFLGDSDSDDDPVVNYQRDQGVFGDDPLHDQDGPNRIHSFKRKVKSQGQGIASSLGLSNFFSGTATNAGTHTPLSSAGSAGVRPADAGPGFNQNKDGLDWVLEGPGRRVGYEDMTAIDWIFEYTKERQRLRLLYANANGVVGYIRELIDGSQIWIILVLTGIASGLIAGTIDIATEWLGDLKTGYCSAGRDGGHFYLNKGFCCWGYDQWEQCQGWTPWSTALHITSAGGRWFMEYFFFVLFSVTFAAIASYMVQNFAIYAKHSGIPEIKTMLGGFVIRKFLGGWTLLIKSLGLCLAVASGMWLGKEGPLVHVACCCANLFMKFFVNVSDNEGRHSMSPPLSRLLTRA
jgi:chloride channel 3/4/5